MATTELARPPDETEPAVPAAPSPGGRLPLPVEFTGPGGRSVALTWVATRSAILLVLGAVGGPVTGDVLYYARSMHTLFSGGSIRETLQEYPIPVLGVMLPQYLLGALNTVAFALLFVASMLAIDAGFTTLLWRITGRTRSPAVNFWMWFVPAMGPIAYFRFDLVPAVLAGAALLAATRRPGWTGALTGLGVALKLWPAVMLPVFLIRRGGRRLVLGWFALTCLVLGAASLLAAGPTRLISPLHWQAARGLQIESLPATPLMLARAVHPHHVWAIRTSKYKATEMFGGGVHLMLVISTVASVAGLAVLTWLWLRARAKGDVALVTLGWLILAAAAIATITNKTLSPQYILWLGGPVAALAVFAPQDAAVRRAVRILLLLSVLTQLIYPIGYARLVNVGWYTFPMTVLLAVRNSVLIWLTCLACAQVWRLTKRDRVPATEQTGP
jgi:hypothetical protein